MKPKSKSTPRYVKLEMGQSHEQKCICGCPRLLHSGVFYKNNWFCSHTCVLAEQENEKLDLKADFDGTDYRGQKIN